MQLGLRHFGEASLTWFKEKSRDPSATRWSLARGICEREDWRNRQGEWCIASACKALPQLAAHLGVTLPAARPVASARHQACRDRWIGWSEAARVAHLHAVVRQSRFLILPGVRVPNLASHVLAKASKVLAAEWL